ncbi:MAG: Holliday junction branch migration protein RuvA [Bacteroidota bacterium]|jgi:Holliday junction DNA helicase RuvA
MYEFIEGHIEHANPAFVVINVNGIGYHVMISINTFEHIKTLKQVRLLTHLSIKEDAHALYGFFDEQERQLFRHLILVNGVGTNTARMILSGQTPHAIIGAISTGNTATLNAVKGVGPKTAQRIVMELQDKIMRLATPAEMQQFPSQTAKQSDEALLALQALGFPRNTAEKTIQKIALQSPNITVEDMIKQALKML